MNGKHFSRKLVFLLFFLLWIVPHHLFAQDISISGKITDQRGEPIIGASVVEKGTTNGTLSDIDGNFHLKVLPHSTIVISYVGFIPQSVPVNNQKNFKIVLKEDTKLLDEVVVVGYGTMKKSDMTGAVSSVNMDELNKVPTQDAAEALQGKISGVNIRKYSGLAGAGVQVKIRGVKTFGSNSPLYIIDGFPGSISDVNPQDIKSMEVLKDGAAAAIYGSVAANGVIIITTKNGKSGEMKVDFSTYLSTVSVANQLEMLDAQGYRKVHKEMYANANKELPEYVLKDSDVNTDWQNEMMRTGFNQNYNVSVRGGSDMAQYALSYNHSNEKGVFLGNDFKQDNARMKLHLKKNIFDVDANVAFKLTDSHNPHYSLKEMYMVSPLLPVYDKRQKDGYALTETYGLPSNRNVMADHHYRWSKNKSYNLDANIALTVNITKWLYFKTSYAYSGSHSRSNYHEPPYIADIKQPNKYTSNSASSSYWQETIFDNILNLNKAFGKHSINAMVGSSIDAIKKNWNGTDVTGKKTTYKVVDGKLVSTDEPAGFLSDTFTTINAGTGGTFDGNGGRWNYNRASFFGRLNYNYDNRYLLQATVRYDGSSKFGSNNRWGCFPSLAFGWRISEERFFPKDIILSNLKLRASWGRLGNENALGYYDFLAVISTSNSTRQGYVQGNGHNPWAGSIANDLENKSLQWETTDTKNIGFDYGFFQNKLSGSLNYYYNTTEDLLITKALPPSAGLNNPTMNVGKIRNTGFELELNWMDKIKQFNYNIGFNMTTTHNKVVKLADQGQTLYGVGLKYGSEHFPNQTHQGKPIGSFYLYQTDGIFQSMDEVNAHSKDGKLIQPNAKPGDIRFVDVDGDGEIGESDKVEMGCAIPKLEANVNFSANYKNYDLSLVIGSSWGYKLYNGNRYFYEGMSSGSNFLKTSLDAWTPTNTNTTVPRAVLGDPNGNMRESDRFLENGDFIRLRQVQLGYSFNTSLLKKMKIDKLRLYVSGDNLLTLTNYKGVDPEFTNGSILSNGVDKHIYPFTRSFTFGAQLTF